MHFTTFVAAVLLPFAICRDASIPPGGADCGTACFGMTCMGAGALFVGLKGDAACNQLESWGCDCSGCDCNDSLDIDTIENVPDDYACPSEGYAAPAGSLSCDEMAYFGYSCHYMETRRGADCTGCLCEEVVLGYEKGDGSCPVSCIGTACTEQQTGYGHGNVFSCEALESFDMFGGCDCSGCDSCDDEPSDAWPAIAYEGMDCNGNPYWTGDVLGNDTCDEEVGSFTLPMGSPDDGYEERTWFICTNCPELECDIGDCGDACERGDTCALPLEELCADEDSTHTPTQYGRVQMCPEGWEATEEATEAAATEAATEATIAAEDGAMVVLTAASASAVALFALTLNH